jgi:hypothetical protein
MTNRRQRPARQVCPLCARDELDIEPLGPLLWRYTCTNARHPGGSFSWQGTATDAVDEPATEGKAADLGLYEDLPRCLLPGEPFVEYGVVEHRYGELQPRVYQQLIDDYSHTRIERNKPYTASAFIASALGWLRDRGDLLHTVGPATGHWSYNEIISYWALPPGPRSGDPMLTWEEWGHTNRARPLHLKPPFEAAVRVTLEKSHSGMMMPWLRNCS